MLYSHTMSSRLGYASSLAPEGQIQNSGAEELCMEKSLASASLIKIKLWKKSVGSVPGLGFHGLAEEDPLRRWLTPGSVSKAPSSLSLLPRDFLEAEQSWSRFYSESSNKRKVYCSSNWNALDFQQQTEGISLGLEEEEYPKNTFLFARKQALRSLNHNKVRDLDLSYSIVLKKLGLSSPSKYYGIIAMALKNVCCCSGFNKMKSSIGSLSWEVLHMYLILLRVQGC